MSMGRAFISLVTPWVLTISYFWVSGRISYRQPVLPNGGGSGSHGPYRQSTVGEFGCSTVFCATGTKTHLRARFELTACQTQQRWADQPTCPLRRKLIVTLCSLAIDPPSFLFHLSAHRYCAWCSSVFASPTSSSYLPSADLEAMKLIDGPVESRPAESPAFRTACARHRDSSAADAMGIAESGFLDRCLEGQGRTPLQGLMDCFHGACNLMNRRRRRTGECPCSALNVAPAPS